MKTLAISVLSVLAAIAVIIGVFLVSKMLTNNEMNGRLETVESSLAVPAGWELVGESRHPASLLCFNMDSPCPSLTLTYQVGGLTVEQLANAAPRAALAVQGDCLHQGNEAGQTTACSAEGNQDGFAVSLWAVSQSEGRIEVVVSIEMLPAA